MITPDEVKNEVTNPSANGGNRTESNSSNESPSITAPKGGGAINSIGEKFQANPVTGTGSMSVPVALSPGRNGFTPQLALSYDSGSGNTPFGMGWNIGVPSISRKTQKGLPKYQDAEESDIFLLAGSEDLIPKLIDPSENDNWQEVVSQANNYTIKEYRPRIEGLFAKIEKHTSDADSSEVFWKVTTKDNMTSVYGRSSDARVFDPAEPSHIFSWMLEYTYDEKRNIIWYEYKRETNDNIPNTLSEKNRGVNSLSQLYLKRVKYSPDEMYIPSSTVPHNPSVDTYFGSGTKWHFQLVLDYGEHTNNTPTEDTTWPVRQDPFSTFRSGFEIRTYRLCQRVMMFHEFIELNSGNPTLVKSTVLSYDENPIATRVSSIKHVCHPISGTPDPEDAEYPPISFSYSSATIDPNIYQHSIDDLDNLPAGVNGANYRWTDLYGEGLSGVLIEDQNAWYFKKNLGDENYYKDLPANQVPAPEARLGAMAELLSRPSLAGGQQLTDIDGDGSPDVAVYGNGVSGFYKQGKNGDWENFRPFEYNPVIDWNDPNLRRIDVDGDGFADLIITKDNCFCIYPSKAEKGFGPSYETLKSFDEEIGPKIIFSDPDQSVYLADMSGDGLTDIVRIMNGSVCYWPNKGYGIFGEKIGLDNAPWFDHEDIFSQQRIRLADVDGSGTTDIIYIADDCVKYFPNQSGNSFGNEIVINQRLPTHNLTSISTLDILGNGTQCLVWSSPVEGDQPPALKFIDLMGAVKPYLLTEVNNNMGSVTRLKYAPSTKFYLRDERNGTPWITKLPFPVQVVERMEIWDEVNRNRFVTKYAYHHGYFDGVEREFRGFGMVEQWDTEDFTDFVGEGLFPPGYNATDEILHVPPIYTKTWFHTGFYQEEADILGQYESEYWAGDEDAFELSKSPDLPSGDHALIREAARAFKGSPLRQEIYSIGDDDPLKDNPYVVTENTYELKTVQPRGSERRDRDYASFLLTPAETLTHHYERNPADPRISHQLTLDTDDYGHPTKSAAVVYPRRGTGNYSEQEQTLITVSEKTLINEPALSEYYRLGVPSEAKSYELTGFTSGLQDKATLLSEFNSASVISYETAPTTGLEKRLLSHSQIIYYNEVDEMTGQLPATPLAHGSIASHAIPYETYQLALTAGQRTGTLGEGSVDRASTTVLAEGEYVNHLSDGNYWIPSGRMEFDAANFFIPTKQIDVFGNETLFTFDDHNLLLTETQDALGNESLAEYDYRVLQPELVTDPNGNRQAFAFDVRGMVIKVAVMGKTTESLGDSLADPTSEFSYDLFNWMDNQEPNWAYSKMREIHGGSNTRFLESYAYSDGLGNVAMTKNKVADGDAYSRDGNGDLLRDVNDDLILANASPRWVGSGRTILDNKGNPIKQYEPYFSSTSDYETEAELVEYGVTPIIHYDPLGRAILTEMPDHSHTRVKFTPWEQKNYDQNDTVLEQLDDGEGGYKPSWHSIIDDLPDIAANDAIKRAATLTEDHADTPQIIILDVLGRPFITIDRLTSGASPEAGTNGTDFYKMVTELDIQGNPLSITDAKGRTSFTYTYNVLNQPIKTTHIDNGTRYAISNAVGNPLRAWDSRSQAFRFTYDALLRPKGTYLTPDYDGTPGSEQLLQLTVYGEEETSPATNNLKGQPYIIFDSAGMVKNTSFDFKGNPLASERQLATTYQTSPDWMDLDGYTSVANISTILAAESLLESETFTMSTTYDALNRPTAMVKPDGSSILPGYDDGGQLYSIDREVSGPTTTAFVTAIQYNERGQRKYITFNNNTHTNYEYDEKTFRLTRLKTNRNTSDLLQDLNYTYDAVGNIVELNDLAQSTNYYDGSAITADGKYEYDALYRLTRGEGRELDNAIHDDAPSYIDPNVSALNETALRRYAQLFEYDEMGNMMKLTHKDVNSATLWTRHYHYNHATSPTDNLLQSVNDSTTPETTPQYTYDAHGNMTKMQHLSAMTWDYADRLQSATKGTENSYYTYDSGGNRVRKVVDKGGGVIHERIYIGDWEVYRESNGSGLQLERETLHISDDMARIAVIDTVTVGTASETIRYQYSNHLGSASLECDGSTNANIISYEEYHPFGTSSYRSGNSSTEVSLKRYRYVGKERDEETGLYYYGARYYAAWLARFVSVDPLKDKFPYLSSFQYASNDPIGDIDIDGLESRKELAENQYPIKVVKGLDIRLIDAGPSEHARGSYNLTSGYYTAGGGGGDKGYDTIYSISQRFGIDQNDLMFNNGIKDSNIQAGQELYIGNFIPQGSNNLNRLDGPFTTMGERSDFVVYDDIFGVTAFRLGSEDRKFLERLYAAASVNPAVSVGFASYEFANNLYDSDTGLNFLQAFAETVPKLAKLNVFIGAYFAISGQAEISASGSTEEEQVTLLAFEFLVDIGEAEYQVDREFKYLTFTQLDGNEDVIRGINRLNSIISDIRSLANNQEIDITTDEGYNQLRQQILEQQ